MESASLRRAPPLPGQIQFALIGALVVLAVVAWAVSGGQMSGMDAGPGTDPGDLGFFLGVWVVMMAAMMLPSAAPMVLMYARIASGRGARGSAGAWGTALFVGGYLLVWAAVGLGAYGLYQLGGELFGDAFAWDEAGPYLAGGVILAAAIYQLTPLKDVCLRHCRSPLAFILEHWHPGAWGALRMGVVHGAWCVGCCWALFAALFALGVMSIGWMAFVAALIAAEKLLPWRTAVNGAIAGLLVVLAVGVAFAPEKVPGLTLPDSPEAVQAMEQMEGGSMHMNEGGEAKMKGGGETQMKQDDGMEMGR